MKIIVELKGAWPIFHIKSDDPKSILGNVDFSFHTGGIVLKDACHKKKIHMLSSTPVLFNFLQTLPNTFINLAIQSQFFQEKNLIIPYFIGLLLQWIQTLHSLDRTLEVPSSIICWISDKLGYSKVVSDSSTFLLLTVVTYTLRQWIQRTLKMKFPQLPLITSKTKMLLQKGHYPERGGEPLILELIFAYQLKHATDPIVLGKRISSVENKKYVNVEKK